MESSDSDDTFILKGNWNTKELDPKRASEFCFRCHDVNTYSPVGLAITGRSGFSGGAGPVTWRVSGEWAARDCNNVSGSGCNGWMGVDDGTLNNCRNSL